MFTQVFTTSYLVIELSEQNTVH